MTKHAETARRIIYGVTPAALALLMYYGYLDEQGAMLWSTLVGSLVSVLALANTGNTSPSPTPPPDGGADG